MGYTQLIRLSGNIIFLLIFIFTEQNISEAKDYKELNVFRTLDNSFFMCLSDANVKNQSNSKKIQSKKLKIPTHFENFDKTKIYGSEKYLDSWPNFAISTLTTTNSEFEEAVLRYKSEENQNIRPNSNEGLETQQLKTKSTWFYPKNIDEFHLKFKSLDRVYLDRSKHRCIPKGDERLKFNNATGYYKINLDIILSLQNEYENLIFDKTPKQRYRSKSLLQILDILEYTIIPLRSTTIALLILREGGLKLKGEESYFIRYGTYKSSILRRMENIIIP